MENSKCYRTHDPYTHFAKSRMIHAVLIPITIMIHEKRWSKRVLVMLRAQNCHQYSKRYGPHQAPRVISLTSIFRLSQKVWTKVICYSDNVGIFSPKESYVTASRITNLARVIVAMDGRCKVAISSLMILFLDWITLV